MKFTNIIAGGLFVLFCYVILGPAIAGAHIIPYMVEKWSYGGVVGVPWYLGSLLAVGFACFVWRHTLPILLLMGLFTWALNLGGVFT